MKSNIASALAITALIGSVGSAAAFPRVVTDLAAFRSGPGVTFLPILAVPPQTVVEVRGHVGGWSRVFYAGQVGFIANSLLARPVLVAPTAATVVAPAIATVVGPAPAVVAPAPAPAPLF